MKHLEIDFAAEVAMRKGQLAEVKEMIPIRADYQEAWARGVIAGTGDLLDEMASEIEALRAALRELHGFVVLELDADPGNVEEYLTSPAAQLAAKRAGCRQVTS